VSRLRLKTVMINVLIIDKLHCENWLEQGFKKSLKSDFKF